jgi:uncharacterized membrane protein YagU involved in acid resistance
MQQKISRGILAGIIGTIVMTVITFLAPLMGMPKMSPPAMLVGMMGVPIALGWIMHFMIGIIFAFAYVYIISGWLTKINSQVLKGIVFGVIVFVFAQIAMKIISAMIGGMAGTSDNMFLMIMGSLVGHIMYGIAVSLAANEPKVPVSVR